MSKLMNFSKDKLEQSKPFKPVYPDNTEMDATIYIKSLKSKESLQQIDAIDKRKNQSQAKGMESAVQSDIDMCCAIIDSIDGFTIDEEDNALGFELNGNKVVSTRENIRILVDNFPFIRRQVAAQSADDNFFYTS